MTKAKKKLKNTKEMLDLVELNVELRKVEARLDQAEAKAESEELAKLEYMIGILLHKLEKIEVKLAAYETLLKIRHWPEDGKLVFQADLGTIRRRAASEDIARWQEFVRLHAPPEAESNTN